MTVAGIDFLPFFYLEWIKFFTFEISFWFGWFIFSHYEIPIIYINNFSSLDFIDQRAHDSHPFNGITRCEDLSLSEDDSPSSHYKIPFEIRLLNASRSFWKHEPFGTA